MTSFLPEGEAEDTYRAGTNFLAVAVPTKVIFFVPVPKNPNNSREGVRVFIICVSYFMISQSVYWAGIGISYVSRNIPRPVN